VRTRTFEDSILEGSAGRGCGQAPRGNAPPPPPCPPVSLEQLLVTQNNLLCLLMENETCRGDDRQQPQHRDRDSLYSNFLATHLPIFVEATDSLEANNWLHMTESKFGLLHCMEYQKTLYVAQQLRGSAGV
jgi:hypothetical protein